MTFAAETPLSPAPSGGADAADMQHFIKDIDYLLAPPAAGRVRHLHFNLDGVPFSVQAARKDDGYQCDIEAKIGYLPFTAESAERRAAILHIVAAARALLATHFYIDAGSNIRVKGRFGLERVAAPDFIFYPLMLFLQEANPFIKLIGKYL